MKPTNELSRIALVIGLLSSATLLFETVLIRFLAVAQFYHFAFLVVSLALLGFGASGTLLSLLPQIKELPLRIVLSRVSLGFILSIWAAFAVLNWLPFDSYSIAWDRRQIVLFVLYYFSLSLPFLVSGLGLGTALAVIHKEHNLIYAANLVGSGFGVLIAPAFLSLSGVIGSVLICGIVGGISWVICREKTRKHKTSIILSSVFLIICLSFWMNIAISNSKGKSALGITISPYKELSYARRFPGAKTIYGKWNASSRVDILADAGTRRVPGLSYLYPGEPPQQVGLSIDAGALQPVSLTEPENFQVGEWLPEWWAFSTYVKSDVLVLASGGGLGVLQTLASDADTITALLENRLILEAVQQSTPEYSVFDHPQVNTRIGNPRAYLNQTKASFDIVYIPLTDAYQPVTNGVYSISENYLLTKEGLLSGLNHLKPGGVLVISRWLQTPPSEGIRIVSTALESLETLGIQNPQDSFVIYRGIQTITIVVKPDGWSNTELFSLRTFLERCRYDLVWAPDLDEYELNRWNKLQNPIYYQMIKELFNNQNRKDYYQTSIYNISPPTDNHPFFFHFFTWKQTPHIINTLGRTWQPFGGSGFFLLLFLLGLVLLLSSMMILVPVLVQRKRIVENKLVGRGRILFFFGSIGIGFMFLEIPLISQWTLFLNTPIAAFTVVVGILLLSSGVGSNSVNQDIPNQKWIYRISFLIGLGFVFFCTLAKELILSWPLWIRYIIPCLGLFPLGFSMGSFFPQGISWIKRYSPGQVPWAWAINGSASVIASVGTAILSVQGGYPLVIILGSCIYLISWMVLGSLGD